jgi:hypothetical protein
VSEPTPELEADGTTAPQSPTLDYRSGRDELRPFSALLLIWTTLFAAFIVVGSVFLAVAASILLGHAGAGVLVLVSAAALLVGLGLYGHRRPVRRPLALGIWIGIGLGVFTLAVIFIQRAYWR